MEHFWQELGTRSEFDRCVGKEIEGTSDSGARMKCLSVSDFQVSERLANKANLSLIHRGLFSLFFVRARKWGEVKSKHAEPGNKQNEVREGFPSSSALALFFIITVFRLSQRFFPTEGASAKEREADSIPRVYSVFKMAAPPAMLRPVTSFFSILTKFKRVKNFYFAVKCPPQF